MTVAIGWGEWLWDAWSAGLQGFPEDIRVRLVANRRAFGIEFHEGMEALRRLLANDLPHVFVTTQDLLAMVESTRRNLVAAVFQERQSHPLYPRPVLGTSYAAPSSELETQIAEVWSQVLGISEIGIDDNFFELGGNSLLGIDLIARMRRTLKTDKLPAHVLYEAPTVSALAQYLRPDEQAATPADGWDAEDQEDKRKNKIDRFKRIAQMEDL